MKQPTSDLSRRRSALRRLFFCCIPIALLGPNPSSLADPHLQADSLARITQRVVRVTRDPSGAYRVLEGLEVLILDDSLIASGRLDNPLPITQLPDVAYNVVGSGSHIAASQFQYNPPVTTLSGSLPGARLQLGLTYLVREDAPGLEITAKLPIDHFVLEIARGSVTARIDHALRPAGIAGTRARPRSRYLAAALAPDSTLHVRLYAPRTDWRSRLAVLVAVALAALAAIVWVWRRA